MSREVMWRSGMLLRRKAAMAYLTVTDQLEVRLWLGSYCTIELLLAVRRVNECQFRVWGC